MPGVSPLEAKPLRRMHPRLAATVASLRGVDGRFIGTTAGVAVAAIVAALAGSLLPEPADRIAQPLFAAWAIALAYVWRPLPALTAWLILTLFVNTWAHYQVADILHVDEALLPVLFLVALVRHGIPAGRVTLGFKEAALGVFLVGGVASSIAGGVPPLVAGAAAILMVKAIAVFYVVAWTGPRLEDAERAGIVILAVAAITVVLSLVELVDPPAFREALGLPIAQRERGVIPVVASLFIQPGLFGWFTAFASLFLYAYFLVFRRWWLLAAALAVNVGTIVSGRRRPLVGIAAAFLAALGWQVRHVPSWRGALRAAVPLLLAAVVLVGASLPIFGDFYASTIESYLPDGEIVQELALGDHQLTRKQSRSIQPRTALYAASIGIGREHFPLGVGFGRYGSHISRVFYSPAYEEYGLSLVHGLRQRRPNAVTDTFWPMLLGESGAVGLLGYGAFLGAIVVGAWRHCHAARSARERAFQLGVLMILVLALIESTVAPTFVAPPVAYYVFAAVGAGVAIRTGSPDRWA